MKKMALTISLILVFLLNFAVGCGNTSDKTTNIAKVTLSADKYKAVVYEKIKLKTSIYPQDAKADKIEYIVGGKNVVEEDYELVNNEITFLNAFKEYTIESKVDGILSKKVAFEISPYYEVVSIDPVNGVFQNIVPNEEMVIKAWMLSTPYDKNDPLFMESAPGKLAPATNQEYTVSLMEDSTATGEFEFKNEKHYFIPKTTGRAHIKVTSLSNPDVTNTSYSIQVVDEVKATSIDLIAKDDEILANTFTTVSAVSSPVNVTNKQLLWEKDPSSTAEFDIENNDEIRNPYVKKIKAKTKGKIVIKVSSVSTPTVFSLVTIIVK